MTARQAVSFGRSISRATPASTSAQAIAAGPIQRRDPNPARNHVPLGHVRRYASKPNNVITKERYNFNTSINFSSDPDPDHVNYRRVTAAEIAHRREPPTRVKMLVRDFIDDSLYNPNYGYFSRNATIFTPPSEGYDFASFRDAAHFQETVADRYEKEYGNFELEAAEAAEKNGTGGQKKGDEGGQGRGGLGRQVWHTPTELFKPHFARTLLKPLLHTYKLNHFPYQDFIIYEIGAGNGSFMVDSLKYLRAEHPDVYERTQYKIIEISPALAEVQRGRARDEGLVDRVEVVQEDVMRWKGGGAEPCFVVALEVFDNFAHDMIRYDLRTLTPLQAIVSIDRHGDFSLLYEPLTDPLLRRTLSYRRYLPPSNSTSPPLPAPFVISPLLRRLYSSLPFAPNLSTPDWVPTKSVQFLERLRDRLPNHRLMVADFDALPEAVSGRNGPVVQTRYGESMVPCETFLVKQGYFDIFFPTDFALLRDTYSLIMNSPSTPQPSNSTKNSYRPTQSPPPLDQNPYTAALTAAPPSFSTDFFSSTGVKGFRRRRVQIHSHAEFFEAYGPEAVEGTRTGDGGSLLLGMYKNAKIMF